MMHMQAHYGVKVLSPRMCVSVQMVPAIPDPLWQRALWVAAGIARALAYIFATLLVLAGVTFAGLHLIGPAYTSISPLVGILIGLVGYAKWSS